MSDDELIKEMWGTWLVAEGDALASMAAVLAVVREHDGAAHCWLPGEPPKPYRGEWFIAETIHGDRVVLKALPEEYTYDYKTADDTYFMAKNVKRWMQFPDSDYVPAIQQEAAGLRVIIDRLLKATPHSMCSDAEAWAMAEAARAGGGQ